MKLLTCLAFVLALVVPLQAEDPADLEVLACYEIQLAAGGPPIYVMTLAGGSYVAGSGNNQSAGTWAQNGYDLVLTDPAGNSVTLELVYLGPRIRGDVTVGGAVVGVWKRINWT